MWVSGTGTHSLCHDRNVFGGRLASWAPRGWSPQWSSQWWSGPVPEQSTCFCGPRGTRMTHWWGQTASFHGWWSVMHKFLILKPDFTKFGFNNIDIWRAGLMKYKWIVEKLLHVCGFSSQSEVQITYFISVKWVLQAAPYHMNLIHKVVRNNIMLCVTGTIHICTYC